MSQARRRRGRDTEHLVAAWLASHGWPAAHAVGAGSPGSDILGCPSLNIEVKARRGLDLPALMRQLAARSKPGEISFGVLRLDGAGPATIADWPCVIRLQELAALLPRPVSFSDLHIDLHTTETQTETEYQRNEH